MGFHTSYEYIGLTMEQLGLVITAQTEAALTNAIQSVPPFNLLLLSLVWGLR